MMTDTACGYITLSRLYVSEFYYANISLAHGKTRSLIIPHSIYKDIADLDMEVDRYCIRIESIEKPMGMLTLIRRLTMLGELIRSSSEVSGFTWYYDSIMDHSIGQHLKPLKTSPFDQFDFFKGIYIPDGDKYKHIPATGKHRIVLKLLEGDSKKVSIIPQEIVEGSSSDMPTIKQTEYIVDLDKVFLDGWFLGTECMISHSPDELILHSSSTIQKQIDYVLKID